MDIKKLNFLFAPVILISTGASTMEKAWIPTYLNKQEALKIEKEKKAAAEEAAKKAAHETAIAAEKAREAATYELIMLIKKTRSQFDYNKYTPEGQKAIIEAKEEEALAEKRVAELLQAGADPNVKTSVNRGFKKYSAKTTLLILALEKGFFGIAKLLIKAGSDVNFTDSHNTILQTAIKIQMDNRSIDTVRMLLEYGANPDLTSVSDTRTPLELALNCYDFCYQKFTETLQILLDHGANPNMITNSEGYTLLHMAALKNNPEAVSLLLQFGADPLLLNKEGKSAGMIAQEKLESEQTDEEKARYKEIIEMLNNPRAIKCGGQKLI